MGGVRLWSHERGQGEHALILLPCGPGVDGSIFYPWFERLAGEHRLVALDLPGHGRSDDGDPASWTFAGLADTVVAYARARGFARWSLLGHSFGSFVACAVAANHPGAARRVVVSCGCCYAADRGDLEERLDALGPPELRESVYAGFEAEEDASTPEQCRDAWLAQAPFFCADPLGPAVEEVRGALRRARHSVAPVHHDYGELDLREALARSSTPVLAVAAQEDRSIIPSATRRVAELAPRGQLATLEGVGHFPFVEDPEPYFAVVPLVHRRRAVTQTQHCSKRPGPFAAQRWAAPAAGSPTASRRPAT